MKEYWVNVYSHGQGAKIYKSQYEAKIGSRILNFSARFHMNEVVYKDAASYRIHVKMDGGYNKYKKSSPKYEGLNVRNESYFQIKQ